MDKPLLGFILWSDSWGVDVLPDYIVSSSALIPLAPIPGLHFHIIILVGRCGGHAATPKCLGVTVILWYPWRGEKSNQVVVYWRFLNLLSIRVGKEGDW